MKNFFKTFVFSIFMIFSAIAVFGQQTDVGKEFDAIHRKSYDLLRRKSYRVTRTTEKYGADRNAAPIEKRVSISESVPPDSYRYSDTVESGSTTRKYESIRIGTERYIRNDGGDWEIDTSQDSYSVSGSNRSSIKLLEKTSFNGQPVNVYEVKAEEYSSGGGTRSTSRYWFSEDGLLLKEESEDTDKQTSTLSKRISIYEYDPNIKIEAPVIKNKQKPAGKP